MGLILFILSIVFVEAATELVVKSAIISRPREYIKSKNNFIREMLSCGYCFSVWASFITSLYLFRYLEGVNAVVAFLITWISLHRLSNYLHNINDKFFDKFYAKK